MNLNVKHKTIKDSGKSRTKPKGPRVRQRILKLDNKSTIHKRKNQLDVVETKPFSL